MSSTTQLKRELGVFGATMMGLGSIVGTGVFISISTAAFQTGPSVILAVALAAVVATCNGLSSAQLAANHPVSGGTYEYGYRYLNPVLGFIAGWLFLLAKSASAATAALGFATYFWDLFAPGQNNFIVPTAVAIVAIITGLVVGGIRRSNRVNVIIVSITVGTLAFFVLAGLAPAVQNFGANMQPFTTGGIPGLLEASALMFVAYTGYGRIATLGEEVREPRTTIPRAIIVTLWFTALLYISVALVGIGAGGMDFITASDEGRAPLEVVARMFSVPGATEIMAIGAITAMLGVLLNLILGLSRVLLAMGRRRDMPPATARIDESGTTPYVAVIIMGVVVAGIALLGDVRVTWSFSAITVLLYYSITNLSALYIPAEDKLFPTWVSVLGLILCLSLSVFVEPSIWIYAVGLIVLGFAWKGIVRFIFPATE